MVRVDRMLLLGVLATAAGAAEPKHNWGLESAHQPVVSPTEAYVPNCPDWSSAGRDSAALADNNYGCAINSNLAAMVADPADLLHGKSAGPIDASATVRAIKTWRAMEPTSKLWETTTKETTKGGGG